MALKLLLDSETGEILGAQGIGQEGVDKRIDIISTAIRGGLTGPELADLELAYAPPYGSAITSVFMLKPVSNISGRMTSEFCGRSIGSSSFRTRA